MRNPFRKNNHTKTTDGIRAWYRSSRHAPPGRHGTAEAKRGDRQRANLPGPPGDIHTARTATDTWPGEPPTPPASPETGGQAAHQPDTADKDSPAGGSEASG